MLEKTDDREIDPAVYDKAIAACRLVFRGYDLTWNRNAELYLAFLFARDALAAHESRSSRLRVVR